MISKTSDEITLQSPPVVPGLSFRHFRGDADLPFFVELINATRQADKIERILTLEQVANTYHHLERCDPRQDMLLAEVDGRLIAYTRVTWNQQVDGLHTYNTFGFLLPEFRRKGIGSAMLAWTEARLTRIAAGHNHNSKKVLQTEAMESQVGAVALYEKYGYQPARFEFFMRRPVSDPIPEAPMPAGLQVRPATPYHYRLIWDAMQEAFRDHWGFTPEGEQNYQAWQAESSFQPDLWKVAWAGDQVAGMVLNFIDHAENEDLHRLRGYTEGISVRRPWRKIGLARSLINQSIHMFKKMGMAETALGVDSQNLSGALRLYQGMGYQKYRQSTIYRKDLVV